MARALRLSFENAFYHITARGIRKENIFRSDRDKEVFLEKMNETFNKYSFICYTYYLMDNYYHLFTQTPLQAALMYLLKKYTALQLKEIGEIFDTDYTTVSVGTKRFEIRIKNDKKLKEMIERVETELRKDG